MERHVCPWWLAYTFDNPLRRFFHKPEKIFSSYLKQGMSAVDIGCGMGYFSIVMANIVGNNGKIIAVDMQQKMLDTLMKRAKKAGVADRITPVLCAKDNIGVNEKVDFALTFWMVHEVPDVSNFLSQVHGILNTSGKLLFAEPKMHVTLNEFNTNLAIAQELGFKLVASPDIYFSYSALLEKQ